MRIFHGPQNIGGMAGVLAKAQRELGHAAEAVCHPTGAFAYFADRPFPQGNPVELAKLARHFDVFHFYFGESLTGASLVDVPWLKRMGKRVFFYFCGCDIRDSKRTIRQYPTSACAECWPMLCSENRAHARQTALRYADGVLVSTPDLLEFVPGSRLLLQPVEVAQLGEMAEKACTLAARARQGEASGGPGRPVRIAHAPSNRQIKGTRFLIEAVQRLRDEGLNVELVLIEKLPHADALALAATCDLAVDQLLVGAYGQCAVETMMLGVPTICYLRDDLRSQYPAGCPIISAGPAELAEVIADWARSPERRRQAAEAGRAYVREHHDALAVARTCLEQYATNCSRHTPCAVPGLRHTACAYYIGIDRVIPERLLRAGDETSRVATVGAISNRTNLVRLEIAPTSRNSPNSRQSDLHPGRRVLMLCPDTQMMDRRVLQQGRALVAAGCRVTLLCGFECAREEHFLLDGIRIHRYQYDADDERLKVLRARLPNRMKLRGLLNRAFAFYNRKLATFNSFDTFILRRARQFRADVVHVHDLPLLRHGARLARQWQVPLVFDAHEIYFEQSDLGPDLQAAYRTLERRYIRSVDLFMTVNDAIADHYGELYGKRPLVLLNATDTPPAAALAGARQRLRQRADLPPEAKIVLFQGWFSPQRNLATLVQAAEFLPDDAWIALIGYGPYETELRAMLAGKPWSGKVRFLGKAEPEEILGLTAGADLGIIPYQPIDLNHCFCSPNKFFEFVQTGVPVVAHDLVFFRDMARRYGVVSVGDLSTAAGTARAIRAVLDDGQRWQQMRSACRQAAATLNWETEAQKLVAAYARLLPARRQGGRQTCVSSW